jgi:hypothetical protein
MIAARQSVDGWTPVWPPIGLTLPGPTPSETIVMHHGIGANPDMFAGWQDIFAGWLWPAFSRSRRPDHFPLLTRPARDSR